MSFDRMRDNGPGKPENDTTIEYYNQAANDRTITFVQLNGDRTSIGYGFLVWNEYFPDINRIVLTFTGGMVTLTGTDLFQLHEDLNQHLPRQIICKDERYNILTEDKKPIVNKAEITKA